MCTCSWRCQHSSIGSLCQRLQQRATIIDVGLHDTDAPVFAFGCCLNLDIRERSLVLRTHIEIGGLTSRHRDACRGLVQRETLAEVPNEVSILVRWPVTTIVIAVEPYLTTIGTTCPFLQVAIAPRGTHGFVAYLPAILRVLVVLGIVLYVIMDVILLIAEHVVAIGDTLQHVHGFGAIVPRRLRELDTASGCKGRNLALHIAYAVVNEHGTH